jgi:hypothetical protein
LDAAVEDEDQFFLIPHESKEDAVDKCVVAKHSLAALRNHNEEAFCPHDCFCVRVRHSILLSARIDFHGQAQGREAKCFPGNTVIHVRAGSPDWGFLLPDPIFRTSVEAISLSIRAPEIVSE